MRQLTGKQETFARLVALGDPETGRFITNSDAYTAAYNAENMTPLSIANKARELMDNGLIAARLAEFRAGLAKRAEITRESHLQELQRLAKVAEKTGNVGAAVRAEELRGKAGGVQSDKVIVETKTGQEMAASFEGGGLAKAIIQHLGDNGARDDETLIALFNRYTKAEPKAV